MVLPVKLYTAIRMIQYTAVRRMTGSRPCISFQLKKQVWKARQRITKGQQYQAQQEAVDKRYGLDSSKATHNNGSLEHLCKH